MPHVLGVVKQVLDRTEKLNADRPPDSRLIDIWRRRMTCLLVRGPVVVDGNVNLGYLVAPLVSHRSAEPPTCSLARITLRGRGNE
jgi:hypothetical protein